MRWRINKLDVKKCDKCGKTYYKDERGRGSTMITWMDSLKMDEDSNTYYPWLKKMDLCSICSEPILDLINIKVKR